MVYCIIRINATDYMYVQMGHKLMLFPCKFFLRDTSIIIGCYTDHICKAADISISTSAALMLMTEGMFSFI